MTSKNPFKELSDMVLGLPLWVKHVLFLEIKENLEHGKGSTTIVNVIKENILQFYVPQLSYMGQKELETREMRLNPSAYRLLEGTVEKKRVIDLCVEQDWTLEEVAGQLILCQDKNLITKTPSTILEGTIEFIASKIRIGEYLVKLGKISIDQLDQALRTQKYIEQAVGDKTKIAEVLINLGYITDKDTEVILFMKEESKKKYVNVHVANTSMPTDIDVQKIVSNFNRLNAEYKKLKEYAQELSRENQHLKMQVKK